MSKVESALRALDLELPKTAPPPATRKGLMPVKRDGHLLYVSGQGPTVEGVPQYQGRVGAEVSLEDGYRAARLCGLNALGALRDFLGGDLDRITGVLKVLGLVASAPDFYRHPQVIDGFSDLMVSIWGENGRHARSAIGVAALPGNIPVEVEMIVTLGDS